MTQVFVDMDGVLADFDAHHGAVFGHRSDKKLDNVDWAAVRAVKGFYRDIPPMADMEELWAFVRPYSPIVLTGIPHSVEEAADNKRAWVRKHLGPDVEVRCCLSREKFLHAGPGDILIDDWPKYRHLWEQAGGRWITHTSAATTIPQLRDMLHPGLPGGSGMAKRWETRLNKSMQLPIRAGELLCVYFNKQGAVRIRRPSTEFPANGRATTHITAREVEVTEGAVEFTVKGVTVWA